MRESEASQDRPQPVPAEASDQWARRTVRKLFEAGLRAADPRAVLARHLPEKPRSGRVLVLGAGKASALMAQALEEAWPDVALSGLVVTRYGHAVPTRHVEIVEASHPVPDAAGEAAARRMLALTDGLAAEDLVIFLASGGGSALLSLPAPGLTLADKQAVNRALLASGATIGDMNIVRKHLSAIKGGRLAAACHPARVVTLAISDVPGDDPGTIASGPTMPEGAGYAEAYAILKRFNIAQPAAVARHLAAAADAVPKPGDPRLARSEFRLIATPMMALQAVAGAAAAEGLHPIILGDALEGEARELGTVLAGIARSVSDHGIPAPKPCVILSGGETTVTIRHPSPGRGGRNTEALLGFALAAAGRPGTWALMGDTDGIDGVEEAAGALATPDTLARARSLGLDAREAQALHDATGFFAALGDLVVTGPTLTNVNDLRIVLVA
ncbi:glycerate kinase type-2 family protein [Roseomonas mucosa]|uniref:glycerate kinase type-2 family protein n=1 Tax=Roseomonas mucosa TaxID=207340 RepID=UPI0028CF11EC|nr:glycerate kinase [Roseomonas mucosa]MDT8354442.1 glycerate kinase [Roseomonas mucosa]